MRKEQHAPAASVHYRNLWGRSKHADLLATAAQDGNALYQEMRASTTGNRTCPTWRGSI